MSYSTVQYSTVDHSKELLRVDRFDIWVYLSHQLSFSFDLAIREMSLTLPGFIRFNGSTVLSACLFSDLYFRRSQGARHRRRVYSPDDSSTVVGPHQTSSYSNPYTRLALLRKSKTRRVRIALPRRSYFTSLSNPYPPTQVLIPLIPHFYSIIQ